MASPSFLPKRRRLLLGTLALFGMIGFAAAAPIHGPLRKLPSNPRYFTDDTGRAIYLTGSHTWANFATDQGSGPTPAQFDYEGYLDFLVAHHHNFFRGWMWDVPYSKQGANGGPFHWSPLPWLRTGPGLATDGLPKFDLSKFDQKYFDRVRARAIAARDRGIYVSILLFQGYAWRFGRTDSDGFPYDGRNNINGIDAGPGHNAATLAVPAVTAAQEAYVRKLIDTVNDLDNVLFEIANEAGDYSTAWQYRMIDFIHAYEATKPRQHPVGMTAHFVGDRDRQELAESNADWISPNCLDNFVKDPPVADGRKVIIVDSDHSYVWRLLKRDGLEAQQAWVWKNLLRGNQTLFMDPYLAKISGPNTGRNSPGGANPADPYFGTTLDPYWDTIRIALGRARKYAEKIDLASMPPSNALASTGYCLANIGQEYLVYNPDETKQFTVTLSAGAYDLEWYDPSAGKAAPASRLDAAEGTQSFSAPFEGSAVLYLKRRPK